jgi:anti-sigma28 factor (negative regulator of flagellin synthesis)
MNRTIKSLLVAGVMAALFSALSIGVVFAEGGSDGSDASSGTTEETKASRLEEYRAAFAEAVGVTVEELDAALQAVALARVDAAVEADKLTEEKAEELRTAIESGERQGAWTGKRRGVLAFKRGGSAAGEALAAELGVTVDDLTAARKQVALDRIDDAVEAGKLTAEKGEELKAAVESGEWPGKARGSDRGECARGGSGNHGWGGARYDKAKTE